MRVGRWLENAEYYLIHELTRNRPQSSFRIGIRDYGHSWCLERVLEFSHAPPRPKVCLRDIREEKTRSGNSILDSQTQLVSGLERIIYPAIDITSQQVASHLVHIIRV